MNNYKGEIMNKLKTIGLSALAGSLVAFSANAVELTASGSAKVTYTNGNNDEVTGNPYGMNTSIAFSGSGDVNGYETTLTMVMSDQMAGMSSASLAIDLGDMGKVTFDQGVGAGGISTIDDKTPTAAEEVWDNLDAVTGTSNGLVGAGNNGVFVYEKTFMDTKVSAQLSPGGSAANTDGAVSGGTSNASGWDVALTNDSLMDGLSVGVGYGTFSNDENASIGTMGSDEDEHMVGFVNYTMGAVSVGYTESVVTNNERAGTDEEATGFGIALNMMEGLSISYGEREVEHMKAAATHVTEDMQGTALAYTMGSAKITLQNNETTSNGGGTSNDEMTEIALSLSF